jgi:hypothetical protein
LRAVSGPFAAAEKTALQAHFELVSRGLEAYFEEEGASPQLPSSSMSRLRIPMAVSLTFILL